MQIADLVTRYRAHSETYYGTDASRLGVIDAAIAGLPVRQDVKTMTPARLKTARDRWIDEGKATSTVNTYTRAVVAMFRWGVAEGLVPVETYQALKTVQPLRAGRSAARDTDPVGPVDLEHIQTVLERVTAPVRDLIRLQLLTAARPGELLGLKPEDVDTSGGTVWTATLRHHKEAYRGKARVLYFGPHAQTVLREYLLRPRGKPMWTYSTTSYGTAIRRACRRAGIKPWHPHQLRHNAGTEIRSTMGLEAAQVYLGHARADVTQVYAERDEKLAMTVAQKR